MVYDVSRNYIGDMHWREDEILQDGDEFELDRGILIQVGEAVGSIEQDLTGLFEKRKKAPEVAVNEEVLHQPVAVPIARPTAAQPSQLRPKTLNALLGTPKARIGRAALPTKSPHELRTESENSSWDQDRPAKRQRVLERMAESNKMPLPRAPANFRVRDDGMNTIVVGAVSDKSADKRSPTVQDSRPSSAEHAVSRPHIPPIQRGEYQIDKASKQLVELLPERRPRKSTSSDSTAQQKKRKPDQNDQVSRKAQKSMKRPEHEPETGYARTRTLPEPMEIVSEESATSTTERPKHRAKLLMAPRKPPKKLMYRELLPQEFSAIHQSSGDAPVLHRNSHDRITSKTPNRCNRDPMTEFHEEEQERLKARLTRHQAKETHPEDEREQLCGDAPGDLFLTQEDPDNLPADSYGNGENNQPKKNAPKSSMTDSRGRDSEPAPSLSRGSLPQEALQHMIPRPPSIVHSNAIALAKKAEILYSRPQSKNVDSVEDKDALTEVSLEDLSTPPTPETPPDVVSTRTPVRDRPGSSPAFQTQAQVLPEKPSHPKHPVITSPISRPNLDPQCKIIQPKKQEVRQQTSKISADSNPSSPPTTLPKTIPSPSSQKEDPTSAPDPQTHLDRLPAKSPTPDPPIAAVPSPKTTKNAAKPAKLAPLLKIVAPKPPPPMAKRKPDSLPAFTKVVPTKPRSPLKKSVSDTSAMRPPSALPASGSKEGGMLPDNGAGKDDSASLWSKEAWDLFGCGRDGIECTYEEFRQKEGLV